MSLHRSRMALGCFPRTASCLVLALLALSCLPSKKPRVDGSPPPALEELVEAHPDIAERDLFHGVGGPELVPRTDVEYRFLEKDESGVNTNYEVEDPMGRKWDAKFGTEVNSEVVASRLHWAIGFHQPPLYYVREWRIASGPHAGVQVEARFRYESPDWKKDGEWPWQDNAFSGTREMRGLIVLNILINNWDLKTSNNKRYLRSQETPHRVFVVKDLGQSFGTSRRGFIGSNSSVADFLKEEFIQGTAGDRVQFVYQPAFWNMGVMHGITREDVLWTCRRLAQLSDRQWRDAFRAGGYSEVESSAFISHMQRKIRDGLALEPPATSRTRRVSR
jgi:hypothetical protein